jgi:hypothetical protein
MTKAAPKPKENRLMSVTDETPAAVAEAEALAAARIDYLVERIADLERNKTIEYRGSNRQSVIGHFQKQIDPLMAELVFRLPEEPPPPEPTEIDRLYSHVERCAAIWNNPERPTHIRHGARISGAKAFAELHRLGEGEPALTVEEAQRDYDAAMVEEEQRKASPPPPMGGVHIVTRDVRHGTQHQRQTMERSTELVETSEQALIAAQRRGFAERQAANQHLAFSGPRGDDRIPNPISRGAANYNLTSRNPVYQTETRARQAPAKTTDLTGRGSAR